MRVFLVDDHEVVRRGVAEVLEEDAGIIVTGEAGSVAEALARVPAVRPDVVLVDMRLPDGDGVELCRQLRARVPSCRSLVLTSFVDEEAQAAAVRAGASGYLLKQVRGPALVSAVRTVAAGGTLFEDLGHSPRSRRPEPEADGRLGTLTDQERTVLALIGEGLTNRQIAETLFISPKTAGLHVSNILGKLGVANRTQAAEVAHRARAAT